MNLDEDAELERILSGVDFIEDSAANDESGFSPELVGAVSTRTHMMLSFDHPGDGTS